MKTNGDDTSLTPANYKRAAEAGRLMVGHCKSCGENHHYPRPHCPFCLSVDTEWLETKGTGAIYSFTVWRKREGVTAPAFVTLDEGPTLMTEIVDCSFDKLAIGQRVRLAPPESGRAAPSFVPADPG